MKKVVKFGGSSLASAEQFKKVGDIIRADETRRFVVPSAPGKRNSNDTKVTDLLYKCYRAAEKGRTDFDKVLTEIKARYQEIIDGLGLGLSLEEDFNIIEEKFKNHAGEEYAASRGEYLNGKIMADYLGYEFVDSAKIIRFDGEGQFDMEMTNRLTREYLKEKENNVIEEIKKDSRFRKIGDVGLVNVGITTGNNNYFSLDDDYVKKYDLKKYTKPLIGRSSQTHGLIFDEKDWKRNVDKGVKAYLLTINEDVDVKNMSKGQRKYIKIGEDNGENKGYKCRIRKRWYSVPSIWIPDAFLLRRSNVYPKFVLNGIDAVSTDTMHRIKIKDEYDNRKILLSYYNSISFAFTELCGRSYGGGVLEILPKEAENIIIPNIDDMDEQNVNRLIGILDDNIRHNKDIREAIKVMDKEILENYLGISADTISMYREIWKTLNDRRMNRK